MTWTSDEIRAEMAVLDANLEFLDDEIRRVVLRLAVALGVMGIFWANQKWGPSLPVTVAGYALLVPIAVSTVRARIRWDRYRRLSRGS